MRTLLLILLLSLGLAQAEDEFDFDFEEPELVEEPEIIEEPLDPVEETVIEAELEAADDAVQLPEYDNELPIEPPEPLPPEIEPPVVEPPVEPIDPEWGWVDDVIILAPPGYYDWEYYNAYPSTFLRVTDVELLIRVEQETGVWVRDARDNQLYQDLLEPGILQLRGFPPFKFHFTQLEGVSLQYQKVPVDLSRLPQGEPVEFHVPQQGPQ